MRWKNRENKIYYDFLKKHKDKFTDKVIRKQTRVYQMLSNKLKKRTALQVKSHHQKMIKRFNNIDNLITELDAILVLNEVNFTL
jgi:ribosome-binding factor A